VGGKGITKQTLTIFVSPISRTPVCCKGGRGAGMSGVYHRAGLADWVLRLETWETTTTGSCGLWFLKLADALPNAFMWVEKTVYAGIRRGPGLYSLCMVVTLLVVVPLPLFVEGTTSFAEAEARCFEETQTLTLDLVFFGEERWHRKCVSAAVVRGGGFCPRQCLSAQHL
jgi:hypothetical protein